MILLHSGVKTRWVEHQARIKTAAEAKESGKFVPTPEQAAAAAKRKAEQLKEATEKAAAKAAQASADAEEAAEAKANKPKEVKKMRFF